MLNLDAAEWRILGERMKTREHHVVLLSRQSVELLRELQAISRRSEFLFPAVGNPRRPMSENTVNAALRRLGYAHDEMNGRGFRSEASMLLNEQGWHPDLIELQLAHAERNNVRAAYNRAQRLVERRRMMQSWANYLQRLQDGKGARGGRVQRRRGQIAFQGRMFGVRLNGARICADTEDSTNTRARRSALHEGNSQSQLRFFSAMPRAPFQRTESWSCGQSWRQIRGLLEIRHARDFSRAAGTFVQTMP